MPPPGQAPSQSTLALARRHQPKCASSTNKGAHEHTQGKENPNTEKEKIQGTTGRSPRSVAVVAVRIARLYFGMRESQSRPQLDRLEDLASRGRQLEGSGSSKGIGGLGRRGRTPARAPRAWLRCGCQHLPLGPALGSPPESQRKLTSPRPVRLGLRAGSDTTSYPAAC